MGIDPADGAQFAPDTSVSPDPTIVNEDCVGASYSYSDNDGIVSLGWRTSEELS